MLRPRLDGVKIRISAEEGGTARSDDSTPTLPTSSFTKNGPEVDCPNAVEQMKAVTVKRRAFSPSSKTLIVHLTPCSPRASRMRPTSAALSSITRMEGCVVHVLRPPLSSSWDCEEER